MDAPCQVDPLANSAWFTKARPRWASALPPSGARRGRRARLAGPAPLPGQGSLFPSGQEPVRARAEKKAASAPHSKTAPGRSPARAGDEGGSDEAGAGLWDSAECGIRASRQEEALAARRDSPRPRCAALAVARLLL